MNNLEQEQEQGQEQGQELQESGVVLSLICTLLGIIIIGVTLALFVSNQARPTPLDFQAPALLSIGIVLLLIMHLPWKKISFAGVDVERAFHEQRINYAEELRELNEQIDKLERIISNPLKQKEELYAFNVKRRQVTNQDNKDKKCLLDFMEDRKRWGLTVSRIKNWGGQQKGYKQLFNLESRRIKYLMERLAVEGVVSTRISRHGNILYQA
jgi:hypothetical protein